MLSNYFIEIDMEDWNQGGNFINKPIRGWLHPDKKIADSGISYGVRVSNFCLERLDYYCM